MNKQEAIEKVKEHGEFYSNAFGGTVKMVPVGPIIDTISQIDEPQKVVVPEFIGDLIKELKNGGCPVGEINENTYYDKVQKWIDDNEELFYRAWLDGYEVEKEKLYTVEIPNPNGVVVCLKRVDVGKIALSTLGESELTEAEIKKDFDWAWQWAEPVEEEEW